MTQRDGDEAGGDERRVSRRAVIATGAVAYGGSMLWGTAAFAGQSSAQLLGALQREIRNSNVDKRLKSRLLELTGEAKTDLKRDSNDSARKTLKQQVSPLLKENSGQHGLSARQSRDWVAETKKIVSKIPEDDGLEAPNGASVYVFNTYNEPVAGLSVAGYSAGNIAPYSNGGGGQVRYTPAGLQVARSKYPGSSAAFAIGNNNLLIPWDSFTGRTTIAIPDPASSPVSLDDDLILFLAANQATLQTTRGFVLKTFQVNIQQS